MATLGAPAPAFVALTPTQSGASSAPPRLVTQTGHGGTMTCLSVSPGGALVVTGGNDGRVVLWDTRSGRQIRDFSLGSASDLFGQPPVVFVGMLDGGSTVVSVRPDAIALWDTRSGALKWRTAAMANQEARLLDDEVVAALVPGTRRLLLASARFRERPVIEFELGSDAPPRALAATASGVAGIAVSPNGRLAALAVQTRPGALTERGRLRVLDLAQGEEAWSQEMLAPGYSTKMGVAFDRDGANLLCWADCFVRGREVTDGAAYLYSVKGHTLVRRIEAPYIGAAAFDDDATRLALVSLDGASLFDAQTGAVARVLGPYAGGTAAAFTSDGKRLVILGQRDIRSSEVVTIWDTATGAERRAFGNEKAFINSAIVSPDGRRLCAAPVLVDLETGRELARLKFATAGGRDQAFSPSGRYVVIAESIGPLDELGPTYLLDAESGLEVGRVHPKARLVAARCSDDGRTVVTLNQEDLVQVWNALTGRELRRVKAHCVTDLAVSRDCKRLLLGVGETFRSAGTDENACGAEVRELRLDTLAESRVYRGAAGSVDHVAYSDDGTKVAGYADLGDYHVWDAVTGSELEPREFERLSFSSASALSSDLTRFAVTREDVGTVAILDVGSGREIARFARPGLQVRSITLVRDNRHVFVGYLDGSITLWRIDTGDPVCQLAFFDDATWVVASPDGRFDTNELDELRGAHWIIADEPLRPLPIEIFARDYYEPRLLARLLAGEQLAPVPDLSLLNRVQPVVRVADVIPEGDTGRVTVRVEVARATDEVLAGQERGARSTDAYDLRLFRDGQLVGVAPSGASGGLADIEPRQRWRDASRIEVDPATGKALVTFAHVALPRTGAVEVEFAAYAFNEDRVKSTTDRRVVKIPTATARGRAYVISIGVNTTQNPEWNLRFPVADAHLFAAAVSRAVAVTRHFDEVVPVVLVSDDAERTATKAHVRLVFDLLAGRPGDPALQTAIPNAAKLREATPDDLVLVSFSCHGYKADDGDFYLVPYDVGADARVVDGKVPDSVLARCISAEELAVWMRDVDAGEMAMAIDACHSGAFAGEAFKPGPMGARGLGQLAYDKRMRILASTQDDDVARGSGLLQSGLLLYALRADGLEKGRADERPKDGEIGLAEWLAYGSRRVPEIYRLVTEAATTGRLPDELRPLVAVQIGGAQVPRAASGPGRANRVQTPALFDFVRRRRDVVIAKVP